MATIAQPRSKTVETTLVLLLGLAILLNYVDRGAIAIAAPKLKPELGLNAKEFGLAVSAFFWVYAPIQYAIGWACDRWCVYRLLAAGIALWAVSTMLMGLVGSLAALVVLRLLLGLGESITFPGATKVIARHVEPHRRGLANSVVAMGIALGPVIGTLAGGLIVAYQGWRPMFVIFGAMTLLWVAPWLLIARRVPDFSVRRSEARVPVSRLLGRWPVWSMSVAHFCATYSLYFVVTWLPLYLVQSRGQTIQHMTYLATLGFLAQAVAAFVIGSLDPFGTRRGAISALEHRGGRLPGRDRRHRPHVCEFGRDDRIVADGPRHLGSGPWREPLCRCADVRRTASLGDVHRNSERHGQPVRDPRSDHHGCNHRLDGRLR
jgi:MFS family permease